MTLISLSPILSSSEKSYTLVEVDEYYQNSILEMLNAVDLMLAELTLDDEHIKMVIQSYNKYLCAHRLISRGMYPEAFMMESEGAYDIANVMEYIGLKDTAQKLRIVYDVS